MKEYVVIGLDELRIALRLSVVDRVIRAIYVSPLPDAPEIVSGVVNVQGRVIPVVNIRRRFRLANRPTILTDRLVIAHTAQRPVALVVDAVSGVLEYSEPDIIDADDILPGLAYVDGVAKRKDGLILIHDLGRFLSLDEESALERAMTPAGGR
ncbi:MAG: chemotaxis protein CheW [Rugosibacter sp.]|nr:MAG: chemotaxis protein CheW [Rugosibacter sp.]TBR07009.1 MAG: chemotaxis protein CheW [Rugosibacter sp.]